jgi:hypothetical protein
VALILFLLRVPTPIPSVSSARESAVRPSTPTHLLCRRRRGSDDVGGDDATGGGDAINLRLRCGVVVAENAQRPLAQAGQPASAQHERRGEQCVAEALSDAAHAEHRVRAAYVAGQGPDRPVQARGGRGHPPDPVLGRQVHDREMPFAGCLPRTTRDRRAIVAVRVGFVRRCGFPTSDWQPLGAVAYVTGVGFWNVAHGQTGHARNYSALHPVTALRIVAGSG